MEKSNLFSIYDLVEFLIKKRKSFFLIYVAAVLLVSFYLFYVGDDEYKSKSLIVLSPETKINTTFGEVPPIVDNLSGFVSLFYNQLVFSETLGNRSVENSERMRINDHLSHKIDQDEHNNILFSMTIKDSNSYQILNDYIDLIQVEINKIYLNHAFRYLTTKKNILISDYEKIIQNLNNSIIEKSKELDSLTSSLDFSKLSKPVGVVFSFSELLNPNYVALEKEIIDTKNQLINVKQKMETTNKELEDIKSIQEELSSAEDLYSFKIGPEYEYFYQVCSVVQKADKFSQFKEKPSRKLFVYYVMIFMVLTLLYVIRASIILSKN